MRRAQALLIGLAIALSVGGCELSWSDPPTQSSAEFERDFARVANRRDDALESAGRRLRRSSGDAKAWRRFSEDVADAHARFVPSASRLEPPPDLEPVLRLALRCSSRAVTDARDSAARTKRGATPRRNPATVDLCDDAEIAFARAGLRRGRAFNGVRVTRGDYADVMDDWLYGRTGMRAIWPPIRRARGAASISRAIVRGAEWIDENTTYLTTVPPPGGLANAHVGIVRCLRRVAGAMLRMADDVARTEVMRTSSLARWSSKGTRKRCRASVAALWRALGSAPGGPGELTDS